jgi:glycosyltransferase involved in cell wall biosynthesis/SAM-dependent methyltransferase
MKKGMVSIIVPNYNYGHFLGEAIESVVAQTYKNWELIIVDDNSSDGSREIVAQYIKKYPQFDITLFHNKKGPSGTPTPVNIGIKNMKGEYFAWLSSDDRFHPLKLAEEVAVLEKDSTIGMVYTNALHINERSDLIGRGKLVLPAPGTLFMLEVMRRNFINGNTVVIRKSVFDQTGIFFEGTPDYPGIWRASEYFMWLKISLVSNIKGLDRCLHYFRIHGENTPYNTSGLGKKLKAAYLAMFCRQFDLLQMASYFKLQRDEQITLESYIRKELNTSGCGEVSLERHQALMVTDASLETGIMKKMTDISRADFLFKTSEFYWDAGKKYREESLQYIQEGLSLDPDAPALRCRYIMASQQKREGKIELASRYFEDILRLAPDVGDVYRTGAYFHLGEIYLTQGDSSKAVASFKQCVSGNPNHGEAAAHLERLGQSIQKEDHWDKGAVAAPYKVIADLDHRKEFEISGVCDANMILRHLGKKYFPQVLDIGCGIGRIMKPMAYAAGNITGIDASEKMILEAKDYLKNIENTKLFHVKDETTPFEPGSFDLIYSHLVFMHLPRLTFENWVVESARLLKDDGYFWFQIYGDFGPVNTLAQDCTKIGGTRAYSEAQIMEIVGEHYKNITVFRDKLDRYDGGHWYFSICRK